MMEEAAEEERFLWEDISSSLDEVERQEVRRVVGDELISSCEDVYAEVRALREIYSECCADTDALLQEGERRVRRKGKLRHAFCASLQDFAFTEKYDCIWNQWVLLYLPDADLVAYLQRCRAALKPGGFIFCKAPFSFRQASSGASRNAVSCAA